MFRAVLPFRLLALAVVGLAILPVGFGCAGSAPSRATQMDTVRGVFPSAIDITEMPIDQDTKTPEGRARSVVSEIRGPLGVLGYLVESQVVGRSGPFDIAVLFDEQRTVKRAVVVSYPWTHGRGVSGHSFTCQFEGKDPKDAIEIGTDIDAVTGATISCKAMAQGVREAIKCLPQ
jgi:Na+-translocating ferredoxin:NAD+ oxidoreductase RnfG subunit